MNLRKVKVDPFASSQIARDYSLRASEIWVLHLLAIQAGYRSHEWVGTLSILADDTRLSPQTAAKAVRGLIEKGLLEEREPFRQGNEEGRVFVAARERIVLEPRPTSDLPSVLRRSGTDSDPVLQKRENEQREMGVREVLRQRGSEGVPELREVEVCEHPNCGLPLREHPFTDDHEPREPSDGWSRVL